MYEKFNETDKAINFLATGLKQDFPGAKTEIIYFKSRRIEKQACDVDHVTGVLSMFCDRFPKASVEYHPHRLSGWVAEIQCHGETNGSRRTNFQKRAGGKRPRVLVFVTDVPGYPALLAR